MISKEEFRDRVLSHKLSVRVGIQRVIDDLSKRGENHDNDKLSLEGLNGFYEVLKKGVNRKFGSSEYLQIEEYPIVKEHYNLNDHHPQHFSYGINEMNLMSLIEMLIDWKSACSAYGEDYFEDSMRINKERFNIGDQLFNILVNTAKELGYLNKDSFSNLLTGGE